MRDKLLYSVLLTGCWFAATNVRSEAAEGCCCQCGCSAACQKVCRLVCEEKKVEVVCWGCKCEPFCLPGPSTPGCLHCEKVCDSCESGCDCTKPHGEPKNFVWRNWIPGCATMHTRTRLMKKVVTKKIPSYKWVVEDLCGSCKAEQVATTVPAGVQIPDPPANLPTVAYRVAGAQAAHER